MRYEARHRVFELLAMVAFVGAIVAFEGNVSAYEGGDVQPNQTKSVEPSGGVVANAHLRATITLDMVHGRAVRGVWLNEVMHPEDIRCIQITGEEFGDAEAAYLARFSRLEELSLPGSLMEIGQPAGAPSSNLTDAGFRNISRLNGLTSLSLGSDRVTDLGIAELRRLRRLRKLELCALKVTDRGVSYLAELPLESVSLRLPLLTDMGLSQLGRLSLEELDVHGTAVTGTGFQWFREDNDLQRISGDFTDEGLTVISNRGGSITHLNVFGPGATDQGLARLAKIKRLKRIGLCDTRITDEGIRRFRAQASAGVRIVSDEEGLRKEMKEIEEQIDALERAAGKPVRSEVSR